MGKFHNLLVFTPRKFHVVFIPGKSTYFFNYSCRNSISSPQPPIFHLFFSQLAKLSHCSCKRNKKYWPINKPKRRHNKQLTSSTSSKEDTIATGMWKKMAAKKKLDNLILLVLFPVSLGIFMPYQFYPLNKIGKMMIKLLGYIWETLCNSKELTDRNFGHKLKA